MLCVWTQRALSSPADAVDPWQTGWVECQRVPFWLCAVPPGLGISAHCSDWSPHKLLCPHQRGSWAISALPQGSIHQYCRSTGIAWVTKTFRDHDAVLNATVCCNTSSVWLWKVGSAQIGRKEKRVWNTKAVGLISRSGRCRSAGGLRSAVRITAQEDGLISPLGVRKHAASFQRYTRAQKLGLSLDAFKPLQCHAVKVLSLEEGSCPELTGAGLENTSVQALRNSHILFFFSPFILPLH